MQFPLISVVLCTYNGERFLQQQVDTILGQTYQDIELIISDDASTDGTKAIISKYSSHPKVSAYLHESNVGYQKNFERAALMAKGDLIAFSDQDDIWLPHKLETLYNAINGYTLACGNSLLVDEAGKSLNKKLSDYKIMQHTIHDSRGFLFINVVTGHTMLFKKELLQYVLPVPKGFYHDWWFAIFAANMGGIIYIDEPLTLYRQHTTTVTKTIIDERAPRRKANKRYNDYLKDLYWIELLKINPIEKHKGFYEELYTLFKQKGEGHFVWPLFSFLYKNKGHIFQFYRKSFISNLFDMRKIARGEKGNVD